MSPLLVLLLKAMRVGALGAAGFVVLVIGIEAWKLWRFEGQAGNYMFLVVLGILLVGALWLAGRSGGSSTRRPRPSSARTA